MFGVTTPAVDAARARLEELGYEVLTFHATGAGGRALETLARSGFLTGVLDMTTTELADELVGGVLTAGPDRATAAGSAGVPQVVSLGALDMVNFGPEDTVPEQFKGRHLYSHNPTVTLMRTSAAESEELGRQLGAKLASAGSPTVLVIPRGGVSALDAKGQPFWDEEADAKLFAAVKGAVAGTHVEVIDDPSNINDPELARRAADKLHALIQEGGSRWTGSPRRRPSRHHQPGKTNHRRRRRHRYFCESRRSRRRRPDHSVQFRPVPHGGPRVVERFARLW